MLLVFHDSAKIGERVTTRYTILHCAILHFTLYDTKLLGDLTGSQTGNFRRPVLHSNIDLFETFDHGETHEGEEREEREERKTQTQKQARIIILMFRWIRAVMWLQILCLMFCCL